jgi:hypothetical protein
MFLLSAQKLSKNNKLNPPIFMKKIVLLAIMALFSVSVFSQVVSKGLPNEDQFTEIGFVKQMGTGKIMFLSKPNDVDLYILSYRDAQFTHITDVKTISLGTKEVANNIKKAILDLANDNEGKTITVELPENRGTIIFSKIKALRVVNIKWYVTDDRGIKSETPFLTMKTIETLFPNSHFQ